MVPSDPFNIFDPAFSRNPYPFYQWVRENDPVHWGGPTDFGEDGAWHVARYADVIQILRDSRFAHLDRPPAAGMPDSVTLFLMLAGQSLLWVNPPAHTRLRALVGKAFTPRAVDALRQRIDITVADLLDRAEAAGTFDVVGDYALPLTMTIIAGMLGIPDADYAMMSKWARVLIRAIDCKQTPEPFLAGGAIAAEIYEYFTAIIEHYRHEPAETILGTLVQAHDADGDRLSESELVVTATTLLIAGHETTVNLIGNGTYALLRHPAQMALLRDHPEFDAPAVEEFLRYDAPSQMTSRVAMEDMPVGDVIIPAGRHVNLLLGSGNHDPAAFSDPDGLDITRSENRQLAFGMGMHYCLGAPLARLEGQTAIPELVRRFPAMKLVEEPVWRDTIGFRGLARLLVTTGA